MPALNAVLETILATVEAFSMHVDLNLTVKAIAKSVKLRKFGKITRN